MFARVRLRRIRHTKNGIMSYSVEAEKGDGKRVFFPITEAFIVEHGDFEPIGTLHDLAVEQTIGTCQFPDDLEQGGLRLIRPESPQKA